MEDINLQLTFPFFPQDQIALIQSGLKKALESQPLRDEYIQLIVGCLPLYDVTNREADLSSDNKLLPCLEYISDSDLIGERGLINVLAQAYFLFSRENSPQENNENVFQAISAFFRGAYRPRCWLYDGVPEKKTLDSAKILTPVIIKDSKDNIWIYGSPNGKTELTKSNSPGLYASLQFHKELTQTTPRIDESLEVYEDIKKLNAQDYPGYNPPRKQFKLTDSSRIYDNHLKRFELNFAVACLNHDSRPLCDSLNPEWAKVFKGAIEEYCRFRRISISELYTFVAPIVVDRTIISQGIAEIAVNILAVMANTYVGAYDLRLFSQYNFSEDVAFQFKFDLFERIDEQFIPQLRKTSVLPVPDRKTSQLYDNEVEALIRFLIPNPSSGVAICSPFTLRSDKRIPAHEKGSGEQKLANSLRTSPETIQIPLNLDGGHWVGVTGCKNKDQPGQYVSSYTDSMSAKQWVLPALGEYVQNAAEQDLKKISFVSGHSVGTGKQKLGDGFTCGDRVVWDLFESNFPDENSPWTRAGLTKDSDPLHIRVVTNTLLDMAKDKSKEAIKDWRPVMDALKRGTSHSQYPRYSRGPTSSIISDQGNGTNSWFDNHRFLLFLLFSLAVLCFVAVGFGLTALFGTGHALEVAAKFFVVPAALSLKSAAFISVLAGGIGGPTTLYVIWSGLVNFKNGVIDFFTPIPKVTAPTTPPRVTSQPEAQPRPDPAVIETPASPLARPKGASTNVEIPGNQPPLQPDPTERPTLES